MGEFKNKPLYADFSSPAKFNAITAIIGRRLKEYPRAVVSYSGGRIAIY